MIRQALAASLVLAATTVAGAQSAVERGSYLVNSILTCGNCHTPQGPQGFVPGKELSGALKFDEPPFTVTASNITPDRDTGIGSWSDADLKRALVEGVRPSGVPLAPIMPYAFYKIMTPGDLDAVVAYLRSIPAVRNEVPAPIYRVALTGHPPPGAEKPMDPAAFADPVKRGFYLATIGHCMECHTARKDGAPDFAAGYGKGGMEFKGPWGVTVARNITSHPTSGIGVWSDAEIKRAITEGVRRDGSRLKPPMGYGLYAKMTPSDLDALVAWVRTLPPIE